MSRVYKKVWEVVVQPCLQEEETYAVRSRKLAVIAFSFITFNAILLGIPVQTITHLYDSSIGMAISGGAALQVGVTSAVIPYLYLRCSRRLPQWLADLQIWSVVPMTLCFSLFNHHGSVVIVNTVCILVGIVMRVRAWYLLVAYGVCINVLHALINDYAEELPQLHSTFHSSPFLSIRLLYLVGASICPLIFFGMGLHKIMDESVERADQADAAIAMNLAVADKLRRYDTDGVAVILAANKGKVDEKLLEAFAGIQQNLEEYRPHIPDYVIAATTSTEDGATDDDEGAVCSSGMHSVSLHRNEASTRFSNSKNREDSYEVSIPSPSLKMREGSWGSNSGVREEGGPALSAADSLPFSISDESGSMLGSSRRASGVVQEVVANRKGSRSSLGGRFRPLHYSGRATTVFVRFVSVDGFVVLKGKAGISNTMSALSTCVDAASKHAKAHKGALQYMQGCGLMVSFNAASRVATHEANACAFALALKTSVQELLHSDLVMQATIVTTNVLSFFAGNSGQLMLTVLGGFMPVHTAMHHYLSQTVGKAASCVLLSDSVVPTISMMYDHRLLGGFSYFLNPTGPCQAPQSDSPRKYQVVADVFIISELMSVKGNGDEDEWLYHATVRGQNDPITRSNIAVRAALDGDAVPVEFSTQCDTSDVVLMKCVKERLEACRVKDLPFEVRTAPTVMW